METINKIFKKAIKFYELKRYGLAKKELFKLLEVAPDFPPALWLLVTCFYSEENYKNTKIKLRPINKNWKRTIDRDSVNLTISKRLFGIEYVE